ncbi:autophagy-related protein 27 [Spathaspora passalidarum NRRL Y-27907]|uniref:Autophagy-related protein 27 n=1 Tax=Spathaspora passalidarum (strain NRRL Y-27907 / 11-Y1) TaxID=619300 RepID=G3ALW5_SPAPN|nr:autophagy-related protein 27 [Spathaspora passalidarum NRRL Y-27907]EGW32724.1 autophagy-related protein 27 [Spathaspora passalidarum NRRL Y-27907]
MLSITAFSILTTLVATCAGIDCSVKELKPYNFESIKGVHTLTTLKNTPPSQTNITWNIGICEPINSIEDCPKNSDLCGITSIILSDNKDKPIISEIVSFNANLQKTYKPFSKDDKDSDSDGIIISYSGVNWGDSLVDAELKFICDKKAEDDKFKLDKWDGTKLKLTMSTKAACITNDKDKKKNKPDDNKKKPDNGESWGWFTWIFIFLVLFLSIYIVGGAWFQYNKGNAIDFQSALKEVLENFIDLLRGLPGFCREIIERFTGNRSRGDYSAV